VNVPSDFAGRSGGFSVAYRSIPDAIVSALAGYNGPFHFNYEELPNGVITEAWTAPRWLEGLEIAQQWLSEFAQDKVLGK
jgi:hypothetical protein